MYNIVQFYTMANKYSHLYQFAANVLSNREPLLFWLVPTVITAALLLVAYDVIGFTRLLSHWRIAITAVFASLLAGSSPEGGSAVTFPVLTSILHAPAPLGRSFGIILQSVGMTTATIKILLTARGRAMVDWRVFALAAPPGMCALVGMLLLGDRSVVFWPTLFPSPWVQVTFMIILGAMAFVSAFSFLHIRTSKLSYNRVQFWNRSRITAVVLLSLCGGMLTSLSGNGINVLIFSLTTACFDLSPHVAIRTV